MEANISTRKAALPILSRREYFPLKKNSGVKISANIPTEILTPSVYNLFICPGISILRYALQLRYSIITLGASFSRMVLLRAMAVGSRTTAATPAANSE